MANLGTLTSDIRVPLGQDSTAVTNAQIHSAVNSAVDRLEVEGFWFQFGEDTITLSNGDPLVPDLPSDFNFEQSSAGLSLDYSDEFTPLTKRSNAEFDRRDDQTTGIPEDYTFRNGGLYVRPYPDADDYSLVLRYGKKYADLTDDSQTNDFLTYAYRPVKYIAIADLLLDTRRDTEGHETFMRKAGIDPTSGFILKGSELSQIRRLTNRKRATGRIVPCGVLPHTNFSTFGGI